MSLRGSKDFQDGIDSRRVRDMQLKRRESKLGDDGRCAQRTERQTSEMDPEGSLSWDDGVPFV